MPGGQGERKKDKGKSGLNPDDSETARLVKESFELKNILGSINKKVTPRTQTKLD